MEKYVILFCCVLTTCLGVAQNPNMKAGNYTSPCEGCLQYVGVIESRVNSQTKQTWNTYRYKNNCSFSVLISWKCNSAGSREIKPGETEDITEPCQSFGLNHFKCESASKSATTKNTTTAGATKTQPSNKTKSSTGNKTVTPPVNSTTATSSTGKQQPGSTSQKQLNIFGKADPSLQKHLTTLSPKLRELLLTLQDDKVNPIDINRELLNMLAEAAPDNAVKAEILKLAGMIEAGIDPAEAAKSLITEKQAEFIATTFNTEVNDLQSIIRRSGFQVVLDDINTVKAGMQRGAELGNNINTVFNEKSTLEEKANAIENITNQVQVMDKNELIGTAAIGGGIWLADKLFRETPAQKERREARQQENRIKSEQKAKERMKKWKTRSLERLEKMLQHAAVYNEISAAMTSAFKFKDYHWTLTCAEEGLEKTKKDKKQYQAYADLFNEFKAKAYLELGQYQQALEACDQVNAGDGLSKARIEIIRADVHLAMGKYKDAIQFYDLAIEDNPLFSNNIFYHALRSKAKYQSGDIAGARTDIDLVLTQQVLDFLDGKTDNPGKLVKVLHEKGSEADAGGLFKKEDSYLSEAVNAISDGLKDSLGTVKGSSGLAKAPEAPKKPNNTVAASFTEPKEAMLFYIPKALLQRAFLNRESGKYREAMKDCDKAFSKSIDFTPDKFDVLFNRADLHLYLKDTVSAIKDFEMMYEQNPFDTTAPALLFYIYKHRNDNQKAADQFIRFQTVKKNLVAREFFIEATHEPDNELKLSLVDSALTYFPCFAEAKTLGFEIKKNSKDYVGARSLMLAGDCSKYWGGFDHYYLAQIYSLENDMQNCVHHLHRFGEKFPSLFAMMIGYAKEFENLRKSAEYPKLLKTYEKK